MARARGPPTRGIGNLRNVEDNRGIGERPKTRREVVEERTEQGKRVEELGLGEFWSDFLHLERRVDDLEGVLARTLSAFAAAESREERVKALELVDDLPTMRALREKL
jgi:hypothetical protein